MGYRWKNRMAVDEAVVVVMNSMDKEGELKPWLINTIMQSIKDSDPELGTYFYKEIASHAPKARNYFEIGQY